MKTIGTPGIEYFDYFAQTIVAAFDHMIKKMVAEQTTDDYKYLSPTAVNRWTGLDNSEKSAAEAALQERIAGWTKM